MRKHFFSELPELTYHSSIHCRCSRNLINQVCLHLWFNIWFFLACHYINQKLWRQWRIRVTLHKLEKQEIKRNFHKKFYFKKFKNELKLMLLMKRKILIFFWFFWYSSEILTNRLMKAAFHGVYYSVSPQTKSTVIELFVVAFIRTEWKTQESIFWYS